MLTWISHIIAATLHIFRLLPLRLRMRGWWVFSLMFTQGLLEMFFILVLTYMSLALTDSAAFCQVRLFQAIFFLAPPLRGLTNDPRQLLLLAGCVLVLVCFIKNALNYITAKSISLFGEDISFYVGHEIMERFLWRDYAWHLSPESASTFQIMLWRHNLSALLTNILTMYAYILTVIILFFSLAAQAPVLSGMVIVMTGVVGLVLYSGLRRKLDENSRQTAQSASQETAALTCATRGIREVLIYRQQSAFLEALVQAAQNGRASRTFQQIAPVLPTWLLECVGFSMVLASLVYLVVMKDASIAHISEALALLLLTAWRVLPYCNRIFGHQITIRSLRPTTDAVLALLEKLRAAKQTKPVTPEANFTFKHGLELRHVSFSYPQSAKDSLHDICLTIHKGEKVGLIGPSGGGKSTLAGVVSGLFPPGSGELWIDGKPMTPESAAALAQRIGYVPQTPYLFAGTLADNVAFSEWGKPHDEARLRTACAQAAIDFLDAHPKGLNRPIGENGAGLSGGQAQRVSIARALYPRPLMLIFDEATSALDQANEQAIQRTIDRLADNVTCLIIAHRLTTVEGCDRVIWLADGRIRMDGPAPAVLAAYRQAQS